LIHKYLNNNPSNLDKFLNLILQSRLASLDFVDDVADFYAIDVDTTRVKKLIYIFQVLKDMKKFNK
jgi:hypothetical protein